MDKLRWGKKEGNRRHSCFSGDTINRFVTYSSKCSAGQRSLCSARRFNTTQFSILISQQGFLMFANRLKSGWIALVLSCGFMTTAAMASDSFSYTSDPGDYIGAGQSLTMLPPTAQFQASAATDLHSLSVSVVYPDYSHWWYLDFATAQGTPLLPGTYDLAVRYPFQDATQNGLSVYGDGRGCNTLTGTFTVLDAVYGAYGYVQKFHATYVQHCEGGTAAMRGEIVIDNPPPPPALTMTLTLDEKSTVKRANGQVTLGGTLQCSVATSANISGNVVQRAGRFAIANGTPYSQVPCTTKATHWSSTFSANGSTPFNPGPAQVNLTASAFDPNYGVFASTQKNDVVNLTGSKK